MRQKYWKCIRQEVAISILNKPPYGDIYTDRIKDNEMLSAKARHSKTRREVSN
jgi:hypothetical protein